MLAVDLLVNGLIFGLFYALMAVGLAMIFGVLKVVKVDYRDGMRSPHLVRNAASPDLLSDIIKSKAAQ